MGRRRKKRGKKNQEEEVEVEEDRLSDLPDNILLHILTFLADIRLCVQTSVLSKRWKCLWLSVPDLIFDTRLLSKNSLPAALEHVLSRRNNLPVNKFHVVCSDFSVDRSMVSRRVIDYAASHDVQSFVLNLYAYEECLTRSILIPIFNNCPSLKTLELSRFHNLHLLEHFALPCLTTLRLYSSFFRESGEPISIDPFVGFVNLKFLSLDCNMGSGVRNFRITGPQLDSLELKVAREEDFKVELFAPRLRSFKFKLAPLKSSHFTLPLLEVAEIEACSRFHQSEGGNTTEEFLSDFINLFRGLNHVSSLRLPSCVIKFLSEYPDLLQKHASTLVRLKTLEISCCYFGFSTGVPDNLMNCFGKNNITIKCLKRV